MMWLDSRPVIEQLTEPLPAQIVQEELSFAEDRAIDAELEIYNAVRLRLDEAAAKAGLALTDDEDGAWVREAVEHIHYALQQYADAVTTRLETP